MTTSPKMNVLLVAPILGGGVEAALEVLIRGLESRGIQCGVHATSGASERLEKHCSLGVHLGASRPVVVDLLRGRYDLVHATSLCVQSPTMARLLRWAHALVPTVCTSHGSVEIDVSSVPFDAFTGVSSSAAAALLLPPGETVHVVLSGPDTEHCQPGPASPSARPRLLWVGRTLDSDWQSKDVHGLLYLVAEGGLRGFDVILLDAEDRREALGLSDWLAGRVDYRAGRYSKAEMAALYRETAASGGALLSTSRDEGLPMVMLEAWACGCPVIVPRRAGFDLVQDGVNGLVFERSESFAGIRRCLDALRDPEMRARIVAQGLATIAGTCNPTAMVSGYEQVYRRLLAEGRRSRLRAAWRDVLALPGELLRAIPHARWAGWAVSKRCSAIRPFARPRGAEPSPRRSASEIKPEG
ncbi:glycosyltransferase family 4 protein [Nannocystis sp. ILAH1]|uniref:glycosyltransferase family 4 protein n=1 Tax=unclassified Nannocystis TaxID=2627009 RepID=UPI0022719FCC|nr:MULTISPECIES: glycosyltransferase family 4 protein [unclassified Nannocystis]MCY0992211.1 glycosyltransferase family 4 protein [Nannocystis sp. ILAH1]MCY1069199.1 glycosyltransferase family 4 protein [Nannocystis sp. RBIL2]